MKILIYFVGIFAAFSVASAAINMTVIDIDGKIDQLIMGQVSSRQQVLVNYDLGKQYPILDDRTLKFEFSSDMARNDRPIVITITSGGTIQQVTLPQTVQTAQVLYSRTTVTLCLVNSTLDLETLIVVAVTANSAKEPLAFNMTAHIFENYTLSMETSYPAVTVAPAAPLSYRFEFPDGVETVMVHIVSPDERCSVASVQRDACPINNREDDIKFRGTYQTFTKQAAITVSRRLFDTQSFFIVIAVMSTDEDCLPTLPVIAWHISNIRREDNYHHAMTVSGDGDNTDLIPLIHAMPRQKTISVSILPVASQTDILTAIAVALSVFVAAAIIVLSLTFTVTRKRLTMLILEKEARLLASPDEERTRLVRRRYLSNPQASSTPSGTLRNRSNYGSLLAPEVTIRTPGGHVTETNGTQYMSAVDETAPREEPPATPLTRDEISPIAIEPNATSAVEGEEFHDDTSSVDSSEYDKVPEVSYDKELIRGKLHLYVADLATKRPRDLVKKYALYPWNLGIISFFYVLPVVQLVLAYQIAVNHLGNQDTCYYNFRCAVPLAGFSAFNNVFSNVSYVLLGVLFIVIVRYHHHMLKDWEFPNQNNLNVTGASGYSRHETPLVPDTPTSPMVPSVMAQRSQVGNTPALGIPPLHGISYALGIALIMEGIMSACYHVCPNSSNFQFDTTYMYIVAWLLIAKIYQTRHPDIGRNAHLFYFGVAIVICLAMLGAVFGVNSILFYVLLCIVMFPMTIEISIYFYFMGSFKLDSSVFYRCFYAIAHMCASRSFKPSHPFRLVFLTVFNALNWGLAIFGLLAHPPDFDTFLLTISIANVMLYIVFYVFMKIRHRERLHPLTYMLIIIATFFWVTAFLFFVQHQTTWQLTPAGSRTLNQPCVLFHFFDAHDIWHFLSSFALFSSFTILLVIDDEVMLVPRDKIPVF